jgi:hypothetical protein
MSRFTQAGGSPGPAGPPGQDANTGNFEFNANNMSTDEDMTITVNGVPGTVNIGGYLGVNLQFADAEGAGLKFPDDTVQETAFDPLSINSNLLPAIDNEYDLGSPEKRWKSISIGEGTIFITDATLGTDAAITVNDGVFFINGVAQAQLPNLNVTNLSFNDNTVQTTAFLGYNGGYNENCLRFVTSAPTSHHGKPGDKKHDSYMDEHHWYVCFQDYVNSTTPIWRRVNFNNSSW